MKICLAALFVQAAAAFGVASPPEAETSGVGNWKYCTSTVDVPAVLAAGDTVVPYDRVYTMVPAGTKSLEHATQPAGTSNDPLAPVSWTIKVPLADLADTMVARTFNDSMDSYNVGKTEALLKTWAEGIKKCGNVVRLTLLVHSYPVCFCVCLCE